jgi:hypothetical protein
VKPQFELGPPTPPRDEQARAGARARRGWDQGRGLGCDRLDPLAASGTRGAVEFLVYARKEQ